MLIQKRRRERERGEEKQIKEMLLEIKEKTEKRKRIKQRPLNAALRDKFTSGQRRGQAGCREEGAEVRHDSNISMRHAIVCV